MKGIIFRDNLSSFEQLLEKSESVSIHHRNLQLLAIEIYKAINNLSPSLSELFKIKDVKYKLRNESSIISSTIRTTCHGINSISYLGPRILDQIPDVIKNSSTLNIFKNRITA